MYNNQQYTQYPVTWYRGYMPRSYVPPHFLASFSCAVFLVFFGIFFLLSGTITTAFAYKKPSPPFDTEFFTKHNADNPMRVIGPIFLGIGIIFVISTVSICCFAKNRMQKQEHQPIQNPNPTIVSPAASYPQQQYQTGYPQQQQTYSQSGYVPQPYQAGYIPQQQPQPYQAGYILQPQPQPCQDGNKPQEFSYNNYPNQPPPPYQAEVNYPSGPSSEAVTAGLYNYSSAKSEHQQVSAPPAGFK